MTDADALLDFRMTELTEPYGSAIGSVVRNLTTGHAQKIRCLDQRDGPRPNGFPLLIGTRLTILDPIGGRDVGDRIPQGIGGRIKDSLPQLLNRSRETIFLGRLLLRARLLRRWCCTGALRAAAGPEGGAQTHDGQQDGRLMNVHSILSVPQNGARAYGRQPMGSERFIHAAAAGILCTFTCQHVRAAAPPSGKPSSSGTSPLPQSSATACDRHGITLQVLGSGGPELQDKRASSSYLVWRGGSPRVLVDIGGGAALRFGESGATVSDLDVILLTHL